MKRLNGVSGPLKVINIWGGPGSGKSTTAAGLFNLLKIRNYRCELVTEFAKDLVWQRNLKALKNQLFVVSNQDQRLRRLVGEVDWCITDSPIPLSLAYVSDEYKAWLPHVVENLSRRYDNYDFLLRRTKKYIKYGRVQTAKEALDLDNVVETLFWRYRSKKTIGDYRGSLIAGDGFAPNEIAKICGLERMCTDA